MSYFTLTESYWLGYLPGATDLQSFAIQADLVMRTIGLFQDGQTISVSGLYGSEVFVMAALGGTTYTNLKVPAPDGSGVIAQPGIIIQDMQTNLFHTYGVENGATGFTTVSGVSYVSLFNGTTMTYFGLYSVGNTISDYNYASAYYLPGTTDFASISSLFTSIYGSPTTYYSSVISYSVTSYAGVGNTYNIVSILRNSDGTIIPVYQVNLLGSTQYPVNNITTNFYVSGSTSGNLYNGDVFSTVGVSMNVIQENYVSGYVIPNLNVGLTSGMDSGAVSFTILDTVSTYISKYTSTYQNGFTTVFLNVNATIAGGGTTTFFTNYILKLNVGDTSVGNEYTYSNLQELSPSLQVYDFITKKNFNLQSIDSGDPSTTQFQYTSQIIQYYPPGATGLEYYIDIAHQGYASYNPFAGVSGVTQGITINPTNAIGTVTAVQPNYYYDGTSTNSVPNTNNILFFFLRVGASTWQRIYVQDKAILQDIGRSGFYQFSASNYSLSFVSSAAKLSEDIISSYIYNGMRDSVNGSNLFSTTNYFYPINTNGETTYTLIPNDYIDNTAQFISSSSSSTTPLFLLTDDGWKYNPTLVTSTNSLAGTFYYYNSGVKVIVTIYLYSTSSVDDIYFNTNYISSSGATTSIDSTLGTSSSSNGFYPLITLNNIVFFNTSSSGIAFDGTTPMGMTITTGALYSVSGSFNYNYGQTDGTALVTSSSPTLILRYNNGTTNIDSGFVLPTSFLTTQSMTGNAVANIANVSFNVNLRLPTNAIVGLYFYSGSLSLLPYIGYQTTNSSDASTLLYSCSWNLNGIAA